MIKAGKKSTIRLLSDDGKRSIDYTITADMPLADFIATLTRLAPTLDRESDDPEQS